MLFKQKKPYVTQSGEEKVATNFYLQLGDALIPIEVKYFKGEDGKDKSYASRKAVMEAFAKELPPKA